MPSAVPSSIAAPIAVALTVFFAIGFHAAVLGRARRDVDSAKASLDKARGAMKEAFWAFVVVGLVAWALYTWWTHPHH